MREKRGEAVEYKALVSVIAENRGKRDLSAGGAQVLRHYASTADEISLPLEAHADGRRLRHPADHRRIGVAIDDGIADDVGADSLQRRHRIAQGLAGHAFALH